MKKQLLFLFAAIGFLEFAFCQPLNYSLSKYWMCHPMKASDASRFPLKLTVQNPNLTADTIINYPNTAANSGVDIFYVYPTIDLGLIPGNT